MLSASNAMHLTAMSVTPMAVVKSAQKTSSLVLPATALVVVSRTVPLARPSTLAEFAPKDPPWPRTVRAPNAPSLVAESVRMLPPVLCVRRGLFRARTEAASPAH